MTGPQEEYIADQSVPSVSTKDVDPAPAEDAGPPAEQSELDMEETSEPASRVASRISVSGQGVGEIDAATIERRAHELARMDGRSEPAEHDFVRAEDDLLNPGIPPAPEEGDEPVKLWSEGIGTQGHQAETYLIDDEENAAARLVAEGLQEADHERRLAASESSLDDDEEADA